MADKADPLLTIAQALERGIRRKLRKDETVVWQGMKVARFEPRGCLIYLFAIPWTAFAIIWISLAIMGFSEPGGAFLGVVFALAGLPILFAGLGMLARPFMSYFQNGRVMFAVTDQRVLKASVGREVKVVSIAASRIKTAKLRESSDGSGAIDLALSYPIEGYGGVKSKKMKLGYVEGVAGADQALSKIIRQAD